MEPSSTLTTSTLLNYSSHRAQETITELKQTVKSMCKDFQRNTGKDPFSNHQIYYVLYKFLENNGGFQEGLWESAARWIQEAKVEFQEEEKLNIHHHPKTNKYDLVTKLPERKNEYNQLLLTYNVVINELKSNCKLEMIEKIKIIYDSFKTLPYKHFAYLIANLWNNLHSSQYLDETSNCYSPKIQSLSQFNQCLTDPKLNCLICNPSKTYNKITLRQHMVDIHSLYIYKCDVLKCNVEKTCTRLLKIHKNNDHKSVKPSEKRQLVQSPDETETVSKNEQQNKKSKTFTQPYKEENNNSSFLLTNAQTYEQKQTGPTFTSSKAALNSSRRPKKENSSHKSNQESVKSLQNQIKKCKMELERVKALNVQKDLVIQDLVAYVGSTRGPANVQIDYGESNSTGSLPKVIYNPIKLDKQFGDTTSSTRHTLTPTLQLVQCNSSSPVSIENNLTTMIPDASTMITKMDDSFEEYLSKDQVFTSSEVTLDMKGEILSTTPFSDVFLV